MLYEDLELYTRFTITLHDALLKNPTLLDNLTLSTTERTEKFKSMLISRWAYYEISGETIPVFKFLIENRFGQLKDWYEELITAYETKIEMLDGELETITRDDTKKESGSRSSELNGNVKTNGTITDKTTSQGTNETTFNKDSTTELKHFDLPRTNQTENKPSASDNTAYNEVSTNSITENKNGTNTNTTDTTSTNSASTTGSDTKDATLKQTITKKGGVNVIELKRDYMKLLRNIYLEFAEDFKTCFLDLYY